MYLCVCVNVLVLIFIHCFILFKSLHFFSLISRGGSEHFYITKRNLYNSTALPAAASIGSHFFKWVESVLLFCTPRVLCLYMTIFRNVFEEIDIFLPMLCACVLILSNTLPP